MIAARKAAQDPTTCAIDHQSPCLRNVLFHDVSLLRPQMSRTGWHGPLGERIDRGQEHDAIDATSWLCPRSLRQHAFTDLIGLDQLGCSTWRGMLLTFHFSQTISCAHRPRESVTADPRPLKGRMVCMLIAKSRPTGLANPGFPIDHLFEAVPPTKGFRPLAGPCNHWRQASAPDHQDRRSRR